MEVDLVKYHCIECEHIYADVYFWLLNEFNSPGTRWFIKDRTIYIRDDADYFWFQMRW